MSHIRHEHPFLLAYEHRSKKPEDELESEALAASAAAEAGGFSAAAVAAEKSVFVKLAAMGGLPLSLAGSAAWAFYAGSHGIPVIPVQTLRDQFKREHRALVSGPVNDVLSAAFAPITVVVDGLPLVFKPKVSVGLDGWKAAAGASTAIVSHVVFTACPRTRGATLSGPPTASGCRCSTWPPQ